MRYIIFNILLIILIIIILFKSYVIKEKYIDINYTNVGYSIGVGPRTKVKYFQKPEEKEEIQYNQEKEEVKPLEYSAPIIEKPKVIEKKEEPPIEKPNPKELENTCLKKLEDRRKEIDLKKSRQARESQERIMQNQSDDQAVNLAFATYLIQYKDQVNILVNEQKETQSIMADMKSENVKCQGVISSFDISLEQVRNCCSSETQRAAVLQQLIAEKCTGPNLLLANKLQNIKNSISNLENENVNWQNVNKDLDDKIVICNKEANAIQDKIKNCNK